MNNPSLDDLLAPILLKDDRYQAQAYVFVREGLDHTVRKLEKPRHVSGGELLEGMREYALQEYGPVTKRVLSEWGINECVDFGHIVFNLVNEGLLGKTEEDSIEDFMEGYDFHEAFIQPFRPKKPSACPVSAD
ncbi:Minf_1886 family protein [Pontiella desulfatans]|nr:Minf_1886 family protein [Pontiella desulfatans]